MTDFEARMKKEATKSATMCGDGCCISEPLRNGFLAGGTFAAEEYEKEIDVLRAALDRAERERESKDRLWRKAVCDRSDLKVELSAARKVVEAAQDFLDQMVGMYSAGIGTKAYPLSDALGAYDEAVKRG